MEVTGIIKKMYPLASGKTKDGSKDWQSRDFMIETEEKYPQRFCLTLMGENTTRFGVSEGDKVAVKFDGHAKEYNERCYNSLIAWDVKKIE